MLLKNFTEVTGRKKKKDFSKLMSDGLRSIALEQA